MASSSNADNSFDKEFQYPYPTHVNTANFLSIKLSGKTNYRSWQKQMTCLLDSHDMLGFIDGTIKCNQGKGHSKKEEYRVWKRSDTLVIGWIFGSLTEHVMDTVVSLDTSHSVWRKLKKNYDMLDAPTSNTVSNQDSRKYRPLHEAIVNGHWEKAREYLIKDKDALTAKINDDGDSPLHVGIGTCQNIQFVENLLNEINPESLPTLVCKRKQNPLHRAALVGNLEAAKMLVDKNKKLLFITGGYNTNTNKRLLLPIHQAIFGGHIDTFLYLLEVTKEFIGPPQLAHNNPFKGWNGAALLTSIIDNGLFVVPIQDHNQDNAHENDQDIENQVPDVGESSCNKDLPIQDHKQDSAHEIDQDNENQVLDVGESACNKDLPIHDHNQDSAHEIDQDNENQVLDVGESVCNKDVPIQDHSQDNAHEIDQDIENQVTDVGESTCNKGKKSMNEYLFESW